MAQRRDKGSPETGGRASGNLARPVGSNPTRPDHTEAGRIKRMSTGKTMTAAEFRDLGFIQEINRLLLHRCGLALAVTVDEETGDTTLGPIIDRRDDPEGMYFGFTWRPADAALAGAAAARVSAMIAERSEARLKELGIEIEPVGMPVPAKYSMNSMFPVAPGVLVSGDGRIISVDGLEFARPLLTQLASGEPGPALKILPHKPDRPATFLTLHEVPIRGVDFSPERDGENPKDPPLMAILIEHIPGSTWGAGDRIAIIPAESAQATGGKG